MRLPPTAARWRQLIAASVASTLLILGLALPASAAAPQAAAPTPKKNVQALCGKATPGKFGCFALRRTDVAARRGLQPLVTPDGYGPADLASAYAIPPGGGAGQTVAIVDAFDNPNAEADLAVYRAQFGLPECTTANGCFRKVDQRGGTDYPEPDAGWAGEIALDIQMVSAVAPLAHILLVEADDNLTENLAASVDEAVALGAKYVSNSYGSGYTSTPGSGEDPSEVTDFDPHYNHPGVAVVASSGDDDYGVSYPAASQYVTSVGGTTLVPDGSSRGWGESVWHNSFGGPGSGCSLFEAKPSWQTDSGCGMRTLTDVSAVADPETGVAVYNTFQAGGWAVYGGTSASSPIVAAMFANAGTPVAGTYPSSYPYAASSGLNDITAGNNGSCTPAYLCTAGAGYDGPTGLGTPNGLAAFTTGPHGTLSGTVTNSSTSAPLAGATVTAGDATGLTDSAGRYTLSVPVGTYDVTAAAFGFGSVTRSGVVVAEDATVTEDFALAPVPSSTVSGVIRDGSGQNWPLYATINVDGVPGGPVFTNPFTGAYSLTLPQGTTYQLNISANYPGYQAVAQDVTVGSANQTVNVSVPINATTCNAPGYAVARNGLTEAFNSTSTPPGWTVVNNGGTGVWRFDDPGNRTNLTGGSGGFAIIDSDNAGSGATQDSSLVTPIIDLTGKTAPSIGFDNDYRSFFNGVADVDLSIDGGTTWTNLWHQTTLNQRGPMHIELPIPSAANQPQVQVRFHYYQASFAWWWEVDNVFVGSRTCVPTPGGLVAGLVTDANTRAGIVGAVVTSVAKTDENATTSATPDDPFLTDGFYWMFSSLTGRRTFSAEKANYTTKTKAVNVGANKVTQASFNLAAGRITINPASVSKTVNWQGSATQTLTVRNTGGASATVKLSEIPGGVIFLTAQGAAVNRVTGKYSPRSLHGQTATGTRPANNKPAAAPWTAIADYPTVVQDNSVVVLDGKVYSAFGFDGAGDLSSMYVYNPDSGAWSPVASAADTREKPAMASIFGKIYASGGWGADGSPDGKTEIYDPASNSWTTGAANPKPYAGSGTAVLGGKMYAVGGCSATACGNTDVMAYDPAANAWTQVAAYPETVAWESCGAIGGKLYCAGGTTDAGSITNGYVYDPGDNAWTPIADLPTDLWGSGYTTADNKLLISGGVTAGNTAITNEGFQYDPASGGWSTLPASNNSLYRGGSACGFYKIGGSPGGQFVPPVASSEVLPGLVNCAEATDVPWLTETPTSLTLAPGGSATVQVKVDASVPEITQPGTYSASLSVSTNTPYSVPAVQVTMTVKPPPTWGKITGTVTGPSGAIAGATVQVNGKNTHFTLKTDAGGRYQIWLDVNNNPLQVICAKDGYQPQVKTARITKGGTTTLDFNLLRA